jgi:hypothetical protein
MNNYLFIFINNSFLSNDILEKISFFHNIHIYIHEKYFAFQEKIFQEITKKITNQHIYLYAFSKEDIELAKKYQFDYHFCFRKSTFIPHHSLFQLAQKEHKENFYIIDEFVVEDFDHQLQHIKDFHQPISFVATQLMQKNIIQNYSSLYHFIKKIHTNYQNPLKDIETNLEIPHWKEQKYICQNLDTIEEGFLIMGIWGDISIICSKEELIHYDKINQITLLKNKECIHCSFLKNCMKRGIGIIMKKENIQQCISYNLL